MIAIRTRHFSAADGLSLAADEWGGAVSPPVLFLHGGGQTRGSWKNSLAHVADLGFHAIAYDARGHGESDWSATQDYRLDAFARDLEEIIAQLGCPPIVIGASLGGLSALLVAGEIAPDSMRALALVDVAPRLNPAGAERILAFMAGHPNGFESIEEAADAIAQYNPGRTRSSGSRGLEASLRKRGGRFYWHWDPAFLNHRREDRDLLDDRLVAAARTIQVPTLLVHAGRSDVVTAIEIADFKAIMPHARYVEVPGAGHMVAGDANDLFNGAIADFLASLPA